jgi:hypothetical protein
MRIFQTRGTLPCIAAAIAAISPAAASSLKMIYQASDYPSQTNLMSPIPGVFGQVVSGAFGGAALQGQLFVLVPGLAGKWTKTVVHSFATATAATDGINPNQNLVADGGGNVWGTTSQGGANNTGTVFELVRPKTATAPWTYRVAASLPVFFESPTGSVNLAFDRFGNLFGTSAIGCSVDACGSVFEVPAPTLRGGTSPAKVLLNLPRNLGSPPAGLTIDPTGNLYGTTTGSGVNSYAYGTVWEVSPGVKGKPYSFQVIHSFCSILDGYNYCVDGYKPVGGVTYSKGVLYGTTTYDGGSYIVTNPSSGQKQLEGSNGLIFSMTPPPAGGEWGFTPLHALHDFTGYNTGGPDFDVHFPLSGAAISSTGGVVFSAATGGIDGTQSNVIYGGVFSVAPATQTETVVNTAFGVENNNTRSGPLSDLNNPQPIHLDAKNRVYGVAPSAWATSCSCYHYWEAIYVITP